MTQTRYKVTIWYDTAPTNKNPLERQHSHTEQETFDTQQEAKEFIEDKIWQVDDLNNNGTKLPDSRKEYGYWSEAKDRSTGKQWYQWATVQVEKLEVEQLDIEEVI